MMKLTLIDYEMRNKGIYYNLMVNCFSYYRIINHNFLQNVKAYNVFFTYFVNNNESLTDNDQVETFMTECKCCPVHLNTSVVCICYLQLPNSPIA